VRSAYEVGRTSRWQLILNQQHPQDLSRLLHYHDEIVSFRRKQFANYQQHLNELALIEKKIQANVEKLTTKRKTLQRQHEQLIEQRQQRERTLAKIRSLMKNKDQELQRQKRHQKELEQVIAAASRISRDLALEKNHRPFKASKGKLSWPVSGQIQNRFGSRRNGSLHWDGVLIKAREGTPVKAIHSGRVLFADWLPGQGLLIILDHGDQYMSLYAHNQVLLKEPGEWVNSGDTIARSGNTGGQAVAGLYFEIRHKGKPTNPSSWCKRG
jgi:septal ring factor EnvC (AmiA/AmiB activator)